MDSWHERVENEDHDFNTRKQKRLFRDFWASSCFEINRILQSGDVSFGDPVTLYLNKIKDEILSDDPELAAKVRIYLIKSPVVNAYATQQGIIFINAGLIARATTETDLAFVISHELIHFRDDHVINSFFERDSINEKRGVYNGLYVLEQIDVQLKKYKRNEFYAYNKGLELFLKSS